MTLSNLPVSNVNFDLFTHLYFAFAQINSSNYQLSFSSEAQHTISTFASTIKRNKPSITTVLSIGLAYGNYSSFSKMASQSSYRKSFILSSIKTARQYGFDGLELSWLWPDTSFDMKNIGILLDEWRAALNSESTNSRHPQLLLTMVIYHLPGIGNASYPVESIKRNLNWTNMLAFDYHLPAKENVTGNHAALYDPSGNVNTDTGIRAWLKKGLPLSKLVLGVPYHGYAWTLVNPNENSIGSPASGSFMGSDGSMGYILIKSFISGYGNGLRSSYNATYVANYFTTGTIWINFDDAEAIKTKVAYAKNNGLLGYFAFQLANDDHWRLSQAAYEVGEKNEKKKGIWVPVLVPTASVILLLLIVSTSRRLASNGATNLGNSPSSEAEQSCAIDNDNPQQNAPSIKVFTIAEIEAATNNFSTENRLGEGGYGPPEYVRRGVYSMKYDVYSFGVLLLQIISGKKNACFYGPYENLNLLEYASLLQFFISYQH